jgi:ATP-dependent Clp protease ATP-binding subunit ClpA
MFERFTAYARRTVVTAQEEARELEHNYIGTEHLLLALLHRPDGLPHQVDGGAAAILEEFGISLDGVREEVIAKVGTGSGKGKGKQSGHIPFTPRAKRVLELSLREALQLHHTYIGTEHIVLGLIRENEGVAAQIMREHADLLAIRSAVLDRLPAGEAQEGALAAVTGALLRRARERLGGTREAAEAETVRATPAADATLAEAARLAGDTPVGSHHLLLAALADPNSAAALTLASLGVDLDQARESLRAAKVAGTSDEPPEEAGRRQMALQLSDETLTLVIVDPVLVAAGKAALKAVNANAEPGEAGTAGETAEEGAGASATASVIRGDHPAAAGFAAVWLELRKSLAEIADTASPSAAA